MVEDTLLDDVKVALRITSPVFDSEVKGLIAAAIEDMKRVGLPDAMLAPDTMNALVKTCIILFAKAQFGYDNAEATRFNEAYRATLISLLNSPVTYGLPDYKEPDEVGDGS